jgi:RimJ/RimL family protein N-acetyltransferase
MPTLLVPWLSGERYSPVVVLATDAGLEPVAAAAESLGMRPAVQLRDGVWRDGRLHDRVFYEYLSPVWVTRLGDPGPGIAVAGEPVARPKAAAPRRERDQQLPLPPNALIGSQRLALRPMQVDDAETIANLIRREPDASFGHSRFPYSAIAFADWFGEMAEKDPASDVEFAVVLRETGELIGETGLYSTDWIARTAESGSWLYRAADRGHGYGTEAKLLLLEYAFERLGLNMIWAWVKERNPRSQAALRKQGYRDAGRFTWSGYGPDGFENARMFDLLATEWRSVRDGVLGECSLRSR